VKACLPKLLNRFLRHTTVRFTSRRPVSKIGNQGMSARDEIFVGWRFGESGRNAHGFSPVLPRKATSARILVGSTAPAIARKGGKEFAAPSLSVLEMSGQPEAPSSFPKVRWSAERTRSEMSRAV
jgi:hypothetical protein